MTTGPGMDDQTFIHEHLDNGRLLPVTPSLDDIKYDVTDRRNTEWNGPLSIQPDNLAHLAHPT